MLTQDRAVHFLTEFRRRSADVLQKRALATECTRKAREATEAERHCLLEWQKAKNDFDAWIAFEAGFKHD